MFNIRTSQIPDTVFMPITFDSVEALSDLFDQGIVIGPRENKNWFIQAVFNNTHAILVCFTVSTAKSTGTEKYACSNKFLGTNRMNSKMNNIENWCIRDDSIDRRVKNASFYVFYAKTTFTVP